VPFLVLPFQSGESGIESNIKVKSGTSGVRGSHPSASSGQALSQKTRKMGHPRLVRVQAESKLPLRPYHRHPRFCGGSFAERMILLFPICSLHLHDWSRALPGFFPIFGAGGGFGFDDFLSSRWDWFLFSLFTHGLRRGLHSAAASRLGCNERDPLSQRWKRCATQRLLRTAEAPLSMIVQGVFSLREIFRRRQQTADSSPFSPLARLRTGRNDKL
jgi:hypothetical protein